MSSLLFDWKDEDPVALIVTILGLVLLLLVPWQSCDPVSALQGGASAAASPAAQSPVADPSH